MSSKTMDKDGRVLTSEDTELPADGMGPRDEHGKRLRGAEQTVATETPPSQPAPEPRHEGAAGTAVGGPEALIARGAESDTATSTQVTTTSAKPAKGARSTEKPQ